MAAEGSSDLRLLARYGPRRGRRRFGLRPRPRLGWRPRRRLGGARTLLAGGAVLGIAAGGVVLVARRPARQPAAAVTAPRAALAAAVTIQPASRASAVPLNVPVTVSTRTGHLVSVGVVDGAGRRLGGSLDPTATEWTSAATLAPSTTYRVVVTVAGRPGTAVVRSSFATLTPTALVGASLWPDSGLIVGVGQPIVIRFTRAITDPTSRQAVLARLRLSLSTPVPVGAYWFSDMELHLRPASSWPTGERISMSDTLDGWEAGGGAWGQGSGSVAFGIGDARISTADLAAHRMTVTDNGKVVAIFPISAGRLQYPTMNGIHIVLDRESQVQMVSSTVGIPVNSPAGYDETVYWDVHVSDSGEYVHSAPWSVADQGSQNVSHGCINLSPTDAQAFFHFSRVGDIVNVVGGPRPPVTGDHGVMDWDTPWSAFTPMPVTPQ